MKYIHTLGPRGTAQGPEGQNRVPQDESGPSLNVGGSFRPGMCPHRPDTFLCLLFATPLIKSQFHVFDDDGFFLIHFFFINFVP